MTSGPDASGTATVGWLLDSPQPHVLFDPPERAHWAAQRDDAAKAATRCPAMAAAASRYFLIKCPYDLHLGFGHDAEGEPEVRNLDGDMAAVREDRIHSFIAVSPEREWATPGIPIVQMALPYVFVADEVAFLTQAPPFMSYRPAPLPGVALSGRFPIHIWPRRLAWAFEWHDTEAPIVLRRGEPLFSVTFEVADPERPIRLVEAQLTNEIQEYLDEIADTVSYVNNSFALFPSAERIRPKHLLVPRSA